MSTTGGYIKIHRSMLDWEWYQDDRCVRLLLHLHLKANYSPGRWKGRDVEAGQMVTSSVALAGQLDWSRSAVIRTLEKLKECGEVDTTSDNKWTLITLRKWDKFQGVHEKPDSKRASNRTATGQQTREQPDTIEEEQAGKHHKQKKNSSELPLEGVTSEANEFGNPLVNELIAYLKSKNGGGIDGSVAKNRQACWTLIQRAKSRSPETDPVFNVKMLIDRAKLLPFYGPKVTSFMYLRDKLEEIKNHIQTGGHGRVSTVEQKRKAVADIFAQEYAAQDAAGGHEHEQPEGL